jgi:uncharacterized protein with PQ loop repeat
MSHHILLHLNKKQQKTLVDRLMGCAAVLQPITGLPQIYKIYTTHIVTGISLLSWLGLLFFGLVFLSYGIVHKMKPYILLQFIWFVLDIAVIVGIIIYR